MQFSNFSNVQHTIHHLRLTIAHPLFTKLHNSFTFLLLVSQSNVLFYPESFNSFQQSELNDGHKIH